MRALGLVTITVLLNINQILACGVGGCKKPEIVSKATSLADGGLIGMLCCAVPLVLFIAYLIYSKSQNKS